MKFIFFVKALLYLRLKQNFQQSKTNAFDYIVTHIVPFGKFHKIGGAPSETFPYVKYDASEEVGGDRKCFDSPIWK